MRHEDGTESVQCSAPANILLFGEYAVLERGGLGIACAVAPRVTATISSTSSVLPSRSSRSSSRSSVLPSRSSRPSSRSSLSSLSRPSSRSSTQSSPCTIIGIAGGKRVVLHGADGVERAIAMGEGDAHFLAKMTCAVVSQRYPRKSDMHYALDHTPYQICVDASACYNPSGQKIGVGSSAASTVCLAAALCYALHTHRPAPSIPRPERVFRLALRAHRSRHGGGSGYDVAVSTFGGMLLFRGGTRPRVTPCAPRWAQSSMRLVSGAGAVDSQEAVRRYREWKRKCRSEWRSYVRRSNDIVRRLLAAHTAQEVASLINTSRELQLSIGDDIGVSAQFALPPTDDVSRPTDMPRPTDEYPRIAYKTVGAGNELAVIFAPTQEPRIQIQQQGIAWIR